MKTSRMGRMKNGLRLVILRTRIGRACWLPVFFLLAAAVTVKAQDYTYTTNSPDTNTITITGYTGSGGAVVIPTNIAGKTVTSIGNGAFYHCTSLTSVTVPTSVTSIGYEAFAACASLMAINVDAANTYYSSVDGVLFNESQTILMQCPCGKSGSYTIPGSVISIGGFAFTECISLTSVTIPDSVTSIGEFAFWNCISLTSVTIPGSVTSVGGRAFANCHSLTSVTIPDSVTSIGNGAFAYCASLMAITVDAANTCYSSVNGVLFNKSQTILMQFPRGKSGSYTILSGVTNIGNNAFAYCTSLTSVTVPASVTSIEDWAFDNCPSLTSVYFEGNAPSVGSNIFSAFNPTVYYLEGTTGWSATFGGRPTMLWNAVITTQPQSRTNNPGSSASFTVVASGGPPLYYQWQKNSADISGATATNYSIASVAATDAGNYRCVVANMAGSVTSLVAGLTVNDPPAAPAGLSASDGAYTNKVALSWTAAAGALGYQVWRHTVNNSAAASSIGTATSTAYDDTGAVAGTIYYYWVKATNAAGASTFSASDSGWRRAVYTITAT
ncbi:leucine-rich repeat protein, partial [Patescibacteria group bacterium]|nr:leucine-rich repeat protein [Patescibacteria group bacterium]